MKNEDLEFLLSIIPHWVKDAVPVGLDPTFYGTGSYEGDREVKARLDGILKSPWVSVEDRLPVDDSLVLVYDGKFPKPYMARLEEWGRWLDDQLIDCKPTHWMPLPDPPEEK